jgi:predicted anti-sigma-YlaC factor YlaD
MNDGDKPMTKDTFTEKISLWLDNELNSTEVAELKTHLAGCMTCRQTYQSLERVDRLFRAAAGMVVAPEPGFSHRFELRLARRRVAQPWQLWLALSALLLGTLLLFGLMATIGGLTLINLSAVSFDAGQVYQWLVSFIDSATNLRVFLNLWFLVVKAGLVTMQEPLFWLAVLVALGMTGMWVRIMQTLLRRQPSTVEFVF